MLDPRTLEGKVWQGDCMEVTADWPDGCLDHIVTSTPYPQGGSPGTRKRTLSPEREAMLIQKRGRALGYRAVRPEEGISGFTHGKPNLKGETGLQVRIAARDWLDWFLGIAAGLKRLLKPNGNFVLNVDSCCFPTRHRHWGVCSLPERMEAVGWCFADHWIWVKPNGAPTKAPGRFTHSWEHIYVFSNGDRWRWNVDGARAPHKGDWTGRKATSYGTDRAIWHGSDMADPNPLGAKPSDVLIYPVGGSRWQHLGGAHFAPMPLPLAEDLVRRVSQEGELVFDPFAGAGTTLVACIRQGRRWVGTEITEEACTIAERRIQLATQGFMDEELLPDIAQQGLVFADRAEAEESGA